MRVILDTITYGLRSELASLFVVFYMLINTDDRKRNRYAGHGLTNI